MKSQRPIRVERSLKTKFFNMISPFSLWKGVKKDIVSSVDLNLEKRSLPNQAIKNTNMSSTKEISIESIKELRDKTSVSIMQCKKALEEALGDPEKALIILRKKSGELAAKKGGRTFRSGTIQAYIHSNGSVGTILELNCESDFVSNNDEFKTLARDIAMHATATNPKFLKRDDITEADRTTASEVFLAEVKDKPKEVQEKILKGKLDAYFGEMVLMDQPFIKNPEITIQGLVDTASQKFGEKMAVGRFKRFKVLEE